MATKRSVKQTESAARESDEATEQVRTWSDPTTTDPNLCPACGAFLDENHAHKTADGNIEN